MTKDEVLQKVNDYCSEKSYTNETLTDEFKDMFANFFAKKYPDDKAVSDEDVINDIKFNLNTAFSAASKGVTAKQKAFSEKEESYKKEIEGLKAKQSDPTNQEPQAKQIELSKELKEKLERLEAFEMQERKSKKFKEVVSLAKKGVRDDLHKSLENYAVDFAVDVDETAEAQAKKLTARFQEIFKDSLGDIKPLAPQQKQKRDEDFLSSIGKVTVE